MVATKVKLGYVPDSNIGSNCITTVICFFLQTLGQKVLVPVMVANKVKLEYVPD